MSRDRPRNNKVSPTPPPRPDLPTDYVPSPISETVPEDQTLTLLLNSRQFDTSEPIPVHTLPRNRLPSLATSPSNATRYGTKSAHTSSTKSALKAARRGVAKSLDMGRLAIDKTKPVVSSGLSKGMSLGRAALIDPIVNATSQRREKKEEIREKLETKQEEQRFNEARLKITKHGDSLPFVFESGKAPQRSGSNSPESLYSKHNLPKLKIPNIKTAVEEALNSPCSIETLYSPNCQILKMSPTTLDLDMRMSEEEQKGRHDMHNEYCNMISARRRVRKTKFGRAVTSHLAARPDWDEFSSANSSYTSQDAKHLYEITCVLQEQKDLATKLVQAASNAYPRLRPVLVPGCTQMDYWQHKSWYKEPLTWTIKREQLAILFDEERERKNAGKKKNRKRIEDVR
ncbi:hypothetical protein F5Y18DRAFT_444208 [Xylariaceae sp. FL1019]|nr:hypothetical protein F5Y18DRAFT_444208 [Xylariaceae sp. FL1019]